MASPHPMSKTSTGKVTLLVVVLTESIFFATLLAAYAALRSESNWTLPHGFPRILFPLINTIILLVSVWPARQATLAAKTDRRTALTAWLAATQVLGLVFVFGQVFEFTRAGLRIDDSAFGGVFFALMAFHALHLLAGVVFVALNLARAGLPDFSARDAEAVEIGSWFWYYVVAVWLFLFTALFIV